jgi:tetratricopeptide (TPR) repeat protein
MKKNLLLTSILFVLANIAFAQDDKNIKKEDPYLSGAGERACKCVDSLHKAKAGNAKTTGISSCIEAETTSYLLMDKMMKAFTASPGKNIEITMDAKDSPEFIKAYRKIETWLRDSCSVLDSIMNTNDEVKEKSFTKNAASMEAYNKGVNLLQKEKYQDAIPYFEEAVKKDAEFVFAWDNLGVCYRRTSNYEKAEAAYKASLKIEPSGKTPLQNLPIVYKLQNKPEKAIEAYKEILKYYPGDAEVYYGIGLIYLDKPQDVEKALDNMCKAYNIYTAQKSSFRPDAEKVIRMIFADMKKNKKEEDFYRILKENNIDAN